MYWVFHNRIARLSCRWMQKAIRVNDIFEKCNLTKLTDKAVIGLVSLMTQMHLQHHQLELSCIGMGSANAAILLRKVLVCRQDWSRRVEINSEPEERNS